MVTELADPSVNPQNEGVCTWFLNIMNQKLTWELTFKIWLKCKCSYTKGMHPTTVWADILVAI